MVGRGYRRVGFRRVEERRSGGTEERRNGGAKEWENGRMEERKKEEAGFQR
jgi:hypothetical protein